MEDSDEEKKEDIAIVDNNPAAKQDVEPFPMGTFISIVISLFSFFFAVNVIYPIVPFMIRDFFDIDEESSGSVGYYAGYLDSAFFVGTITSSIIWSRLSDIYGRRPMILIGLFGTSICALLFGLSFNYYFAIFIRFIWGVFDGNIGIIKTILGEIARKTNQARLYSIMGVCGGVGRLFGNLIGGWLTNETVGLSTRFTYLLPCLISSLISFITFIIVYCKLEETNYNKKKQFFGNKLKGKVVDFGHEDKNPQIPKQMGNKIKNAMVQVTALKWNKNKGGKYDKLDLSDDEDQDGAYTGQRLLIDNVDDSSDDNDDDNKSDDDLEPEQKPKKRVKKRGKFEGFRPTFYDQYAVVPESKPSVMEVFKKHNIWVSTIFYGFLAFLSAGYQSVFVVWVQSDVNEFGLDWKESSIGTVSAIVGPIYVTFQLCCFVKYVKWKGYTKAAKINLSIYLVFILFLPHLGYNILRFQDELIQTVVICIYVSIAFSVRIMCFALSTVFINSAAAPKERATANGIGQTISSLNKILAPIMLTNIYSWSITFDVWPFNYCLPFYIQAFVALIAVFWIHMMPSRDFEKLCKQFKSKKKRKKPSQNRPKSMSDSDSSIR